MGFFDWFKKWKKHNPKLPKAPEPPDSATRIHLKTTSLQWRSMSDVVLALRALDGRVSISGKTVNLKGCVLSGVGLPRPSDDQNENAPGINISIPGFVMTNGWVDDLPGGIIVKSGYCSFEKLRFINIGEDAISTTGETARGIRLSQCEFWNDKSGDKSVQLNQALDGSMSGCKIVGGITGIRVQKDSYRTPNVIFKIRDCEFIGCETGINAAGNARVDVFGSKFKDVRETYLKNGKSKVVIKK